MDTSDQSEAAPGEAATRRLRTLEEKLSILAEATRPGASVAAVARKHDVNANLVFAWRRLHRRGLLEGQRHAPPLLPVTITTPTVTPTRRASGGVAKSRAARVRSGTPTAESCIEILLGEDIRLRLRGEAQRAVLARILDWLPSR
jgi:transposase